MRRIHLFEILDQAWCPRMVRDGATDCLEAIIRATDVYRPVRDRVLAAIGVCGAKRVIDLCSGGGGPWVSRQWRGCLERDAALHVALTDKFPSSVLSDRVRQCSRLTSVACSVDATRVPRELRGFRTIFSSFHHFPDAMASEILADAVDSQDGFASAEVTSRSLRALLTIFVLPAYVWLLTPWIRPFRWSRLLLTYLVPAIPFVIFWDGVISCLRTRTPEELLQLTAPFPEYEWKAGYGKGAWLAPVYLIGVPRGPASEQVA
ncbi:MAG TPA: hypothetical protein VGR96_12185 [Acidobacteriaceae bacterium]|nr:hypothetical protein [Acidobacteriaceae bacterium]